MVQLIFSEVLYFQRHPTPKSLLHLESPLPLPPAEIFPPSHTPGPCPTPSKRHGPITLMLRRSHTRCTLWRRPVLPEIISAQSFMVCSASSHDRSSAFIPSGRLILGIVTILFFQCLAALSNPVHRRGEGIKWGLVSYTVVIFSVVTVLIAMGFRMLSTCYIDNRESPGADAAFPPGPPGYQLLISNNALSIIPNAMFSLSN